jgi:hypothetical protein
MFTDQLDNFDADDEEGESSQREEQRTTELAAKKKKKKEGYRKMNDIAENEKLEYQKLNKSSDPNFSAADHLKLSGEASRNSCGVPSTKKGI